MTKPSLVARDASAVGVLKGVAERSGEASQDRSVHRIVIVGGGAAGLELATRLGRHSASSVELVECARTHLWKPRALLGIPGAVLRMLARGVMQRTGPEVKLH
jgi:hypothetical protein